MASPVIHDIFDLTLLFRNTRLLFHFGDDKMAASSL